MRNLKNKMTKILPSHAIYVIKDFFDIRKEQNEILLNIDTSFKANHTRISWNKEKHFQDTQQLIVVDSKCLSCSRRFYFLVYKQGNIISISTANSSSMKVLICY